MKLNKRRLLTKPLFPLRDDALSQNAWGSMEAVITLTTVEIAQRVVTYEFDVIVVNNHRWGGILIRSFPGGEPPLNLHFIHIVNALFGEQSIFIRGHRSGGRMSLAVLRSE